MAKQAQKTTTKTKTSTAKKTKPEQKTDNRIIVLLVEENPKKTGSAASAKFELYRGRPTVTEFRAKCRENDKLKNRTSLNYDIAKEYIKLEKAKGNAEATSA
jgi:hypothetical protein